MRPTRALVTLSVLVALLWSAPPAVQPADAHAEIRESEPAAGDTTATGTDELVLRFISLDTTEPVEVAVLGPDGDDVVAGSPVVLEDGTVEVPLEPLSGGEHTVRWRAISADGDGEAEGTFTFTAEATGGGLGVWLLWVFALAVPAAIFLWPGARKKEKA